MRTISNIKQGTTVLVTGASTKIGCNVAQMLAQNGLRVIAADHDLDAAWRPVLNYPGSCALAFNHFDESSCHELAEAIVLRYSHLDVTIDASNPLYISNNSYHLPHTSPLFIANMGSTPLIRACLPLLLESNGFLIQIASPTANDGGSDVPLKTIRHDAVELAGYFGTSCYEPNNAPFLLAQNQRERVA